MCSLGTKPRVPCIFHPTQKSNIIELLSVYKDVQLVVKASILRLLIIRISLSSLYLSISSLLPPPPFLYPLDLVVANGFRKPTTVGLGRARIESLSRLYSFHSA